MSIDGSVQRLMARSGVHIQEAASGDGFTYLTTADLLIYCQAKLRQADDEIKTSMSNLDSITHAQQALTNLKSKVPSGQSAIDQANCQAEIDRATKAMAGDKQQKFVVDGKTYDCTTPDGRDAISKYQEDQKAKLEGLKKAGGDFPAEVEKVAVELDAIGQHEAAEAVRKSSRDLGPNPDAGARERFLKDIDSQVSSIGSSREMAMVRMQSLVSQRGTMLQMVTNMMNSLNEAQKNIAANMGR